MFHIISQIWQKQWKPRKETAIGNAAGGILRSFPPTLQICAITCLIVKSTARSNIKGNWSCFSRGGVPHRIIGNQINIFLWLFGAIRRKRQGLNMEESLTPNLRWFYRSYILVSVNVRRIKMK